MTSSKDILVVQIGNTSFKWALFKGANISASGRSFSASELPLSEFIDSGAQLFFSSDSKKAQLDLFIQLFPFAKEIPLSNYPKHKYSVGMPGLDRLANVAAATQEFPNDTCLIIDFGTCITYTLCKANTLLEGAISPGINLRLKAMHEQTGKLPLTETPSISPKKFGNTTEENMHAGVFHGIVFEINGFIQIGKQHTNQLKVILTGSDASNFAGHIDYPIFADEFLTLKGLRQIIS
ncbi:MAG: type III pantothenate kinase [Bacteroidota bacterium]